jgi:hypothetical protein
MKIKNRIKELRYVKASEIAPNPKNWRTHPKEQADALRGVLAEVGMADAVLARELKDGSLMLIDGHMRAETFGDEPVAVLVLDVTEEEADKLLAVFDPIAAMAGVNKNSLEELLAGIATDSDPLNSLLEQLAKTNGIFEKQDEEQEEPEEDESGDDEPDRMPPPSGVRMVQLFLNETTIVEFQKFAQELGEHYKTDNITDTVYEALSRAHSSMRDES